MFWNGVNEVFNALNKVIENGENVYKLINSYQFSMYCLAYTDLVFQYFIEDNNIILNKPVKTFKQCVDCWFDYKRRFGVKAMRRLAA